MIAIDLEKPVERPQVHQSQGIGSALVRRGLELPAAQAVEAVIVVGHTDFYPRFSPFQGHEAYMGLEFKPGALAGRQGTCRYPDAFAL